MTQILQTNELFAVNKELINKIKNEKSLSLDKNHLEEIILALKNANDPDKNLQKLSQATLTEAQHRVGYASALLQISRNKSLMHQGSNFHHTNLAAAIQFALLVENHWSDSIKDVLTQHSGAASGKVFIPVDDRDKDFVRNHLMKGIVETVLDRKIQK